MEIVQVNSIKAWLLAARPKTLAGAATPVLLGCALLCLRFSDADRRQLH